MSPLERSRFIRDLRGVPGRYKAVLWVLNSHADRNGKCWPSRRLIALESGFSYGNAYEATEWLAKAGLILRVPRPGRSAVVMLAFEQYNAAKATPSHPDAPPRHTVTPKQYSRRGPRKPKPSLIDSPRFDASAPPDRRCPICGAAAANLERGGYCFLHRAKAHGHL